MTSFEEFSDKHKVTVRPDFEKLKSFPYREKLNFKMFSRFGIFSDQGDSLKINNNDYIKIKNLANELNILDDMANLCCILEYLKIENETIQSRNTENYNLHLKSLDNDRRHVAKYLLEEKKRQISKVIFKTSQGGKSVEIENPKVLFELWKVIEKNYASKDVFIDDRKQSYKDILEKNTIAELQKGRELKKELAIKISNYYSKLGHNARCFLIGSLFAFSEIEPKWSLEFFATLDLSYKTYAEYIRVNVTKLIQIK